MHCFPVTKVTAVKVSCVTFPLMLFNTTNIIVTDYSVRNIEDTDEAQYLFIYDVDAARDYTIFKVAPNGRQYTEKIKTWYTHKSC